jgi:hypothetical protein
MLREPLLRQDFIRINSTDLFAADRSVMPEQIATVADDLVILRVSRQQLLKD